MSFEKLLLGVSALACSSAAAAQQAPESTAAVTTLDTAPPSEPGAGQDIVVVGIRHSLERAAEIKRDAAQVVDSIVSEDIGKFPDPTTAAALQRVPGVQVSVSQTNQVGNVKIRGLGDILTTLDGRDIFTTTGRSFSLTDLPAEALARVDVIKTTTADLIEGGIAGTIDLQLNKPFNFKKGTIVLNARGNYSDNAKSFDPQLGFLATDTWHTGIGDIGALLNVTWSRTHYNQYFTRDGERRSPAGAPFNVPGVLAPNVGANNVYSGVYERPQANASIQWQASDNLQVYLDGLYTGYRSKDTRSLFTAQFFPTNDAGLENIQLTDRCIDVRATAKGQNPRQIVDTKGTIDPSDDVTTLEPYTVQHLCQLASGTFVNSFTQQHTEASKDRSDNFLGATGVKYTSDNVDLNADVSYQYSKDRANTILLEFGQRIPEWNYVANTGSGSVSDIPGDYLTSSDNIVLSNGFNQTYSKSSGDLFAAKFDSTFKIDSILKKFQFGGRYAKRGAVFDQAVVNTKPPGGALGTPSEGNAVRVDSLGLPDDFYGYMPSVPLLNGGERALIPNPVFLRSEDDLDILRGIYGLPAGAPDYQPQRRFDADETTVAFYAQAAYEIPVGGMTLDGLFGVRPTRTTRTIRGSSQVSVPATSGSPAHTEIRPLSATTTDTDILPNASARLQIGGGLQARLTYSQSIRRPDFSSLNPGISYQLATNPSLLNSGSSGNPDLRPQKSENFDASLEYYFRNGYVAIAAYKRNITDRVVTSASAEPIDGILYNISRPRNIGSAELKGIEVSGQTFLDFLPGPLSGFGLFGNFTVADTKVRGNDKLAGFPLQGVSKYNYNAGILYEKYGISARAVYTYRSRYYDGDMTGSLDLRPIDPARADDPTYQPTLLNYVKPAGRLDVGITYDLNDNLRLDFGGTNILGSKYESYFGVPYLGNQYRFDDTTYTVGVRWRL